MSATTVLVRDRVSGGIVRLRRRDEPVKLRVCRGCGRAKLNADGACCATAE